MTPEEEAAKMAFLLAARSQRVCANCGRGGSDWQAHHVIEKQILRRWGREDLLWHEDNAMRLCNNPCHENHTNGTRLNLTVLSDANYGFAFWAIGARAYDELRRKYRGEDPRLSDHLTKYEAAHGNEPTT